MLDRIPSMPLVLGSIALGLMLLLLNKFVGVKSHENEPPFIPTLIPYFGHLLGVIKNGTSYYEKIAKRHGHRLFSLAMPGGRIYIANSADVISEIQKKPRSLSFWFIEATLTKNLGGISDEANTILLDNARGDKGQNSLVVDGMKGTHQAMAGDHLDRMTLASIRRVEEEVNEAKITNKEMDLWDWAQHIFTLAVSRGVYGPDNPYEDERVERGLSVFADHTQTFLTGLPPWLFIPTAYKAREYMVTRFEKYFAARSERDGSELVRARAKVLRDYGVSEADIARFETVNGFGILLNLLPTAFWTIYHVFSDPELLDAVRKEAKAAGLHECANMLPESAKDLEKLDCLPLLTSTMKEALRFHAAGSAARMVMDDHILDGKYLLKRDTYVLIPTKSASFDRNSWGDNVDRFTADRFCSSGGEKIHPAAFRSFGGGVNLCPGRVFSTRLITAVVAALALRYEVRPRSGNGKWEDPGHDESNMVITLARPAKRITVGFEARAAGEGPPFDG